MPAPKTKLTKRVIERALFHQKNKWSPQEASDWSGIKYRTLLALLREGLVPTIPVGPAQEQDMGNGKRRRRACNRYMIPARGLSSRWFENIGAA